MNNQNTINDIRSKLNIVDIVSEYVPLTKKGQYYWGICPFHNDKNPSMSVDEKRQTYTCWSCHNSGNVFNFVEQIENISFKDALKKLGSRVGITVEGSSSYKSKAVSLVAESKSHDLITELPGMYTFTSNAYDSGFIRAIPALALLIASIVAAFFI